MSTTYNGCEVSVTVSTDINNVPASSALKDFIFPVTFHFPVSFIFLSSKNISFVLYLELRIKI